MLDKIKYLKKRNVHSLAEGQLLLRMWRYEWNVKITATQHIAKCVMAEKNNKKIETVKKQK